MLLRLIPIAIPLLASCTPTPPKPSWALQFDGVQEGLWAEATFCTCNFTRHAFADDNQVGDPPSVAIECSYPEQNGKIWLQLTPTRERTFIGTFTDVQGGRFDGCGGAATAAVFDAEVTLEERGLHGSYWVHFDAIRVCGDLATDVKAQCADDIGLEGL
ncbi:MAG: hypothetical protein AB8H79_08500 [Myxococcota bacterium]